MKKKGFTLIELIVVIAIIGVLSAILVPAMIGYVVKSKISTQNTAAKQLYNGLNAAMVEMATIDLPPKKLVGTRKTTGAKIYAQKDLDIITEMRKTNPDMFGILYAKVAQYFSDVAKISEICYQLRGDGCTGVGVITGNYPGTYPVAITVEEYRGHNSDWDCTQALEFALDTTGLSPIEDP